MATLSRRAGKTPGYEIRFFDPHGRRLTLYLGGRRYSEKTANELKGIVETLVYYRDNAITVPDKRTLAWLESASPEIREKLGNAGLIVVPPTHTVKELWDTFLKSKNGIKDSTMKTYTDAQRRFFMFFDGKELLGNITKDHILRWKGNLLEELAVSSVASYMKQAKAVFTWAVRENWIEKSPLDGIGRGSFVNRSKDRFVSMDEYRRLLDACPCSDWKAILALVRIGGLRCPSEVVALRWEDVNWERNCFCVCSPKTEHLDGKESRIVPIFPELKAELETLFFDPDSEGREHVINRYRDPKQNPGTTFAKIAKRAGLPPIPRPFDNMRMTRSNEVYNRWGAFKESQWIGHSGRVRADHYLMIQDADYQEAARWEIPPVGEGKAESGRRSDLGKARLERKVG